MEVWSLCHQSNLGGHRGLEGTLNKFLKGFFLLSARQKIRFLNTVILALIKNRVCLYGPEKLYMDLVSICRKQ